MALSIFQVHQLLRHKTESHRVHSGPVGGKTPGLERDHGPAEHPASDGSRRRGSGAGERSRLVAVTSVRLRVTDVSCITSMTNLLRGLCDEKFVPIGR